VAGAGYYGRDAATQRSRIQRYPLPQSIELGQLLAGGPDSVLAQARAISDALGAGVLELTFLPVGREKALRSIELFGARVLPRLREL
jgi:alkanesulfonate monooxygenase SsuD/methylene tetrahydromethanopterin reductase-like flavin-dependent oxidoreductase (luciferase family)